MFLRSVLRRFVAATIAAAGFVLAAPALAQPAPDGGGRQPPRLEDLRRMPPAERRETWRKMNPDERAAVRGQIPPEQREEFRQRREERARERDRRGDLADGLHDRRRLSPEERQRLRDQINETNREMPWRGRRHELQRKGGGR